ncbi:MAG: glycosyltransferase family 4 protein [archaeon]
MVKKKLISSKVRKVGGKRLRILMLNYEFPPLGGGAGNATYYLLKEFSKFKNLEIDLITSSTGKYKEETFAKNIKIYYLDIGKKGSLHYQKNSDLLKYSLKAYKLAKKLKKERGYNLCHAFFGIPCGYIAMKLNIPYIVSLRGSDVPGHNPKYNLLDSLLFRRLSKKIWRNAREVIANSEDLKNEAEMIKEDIKIIPNGVDSSFYKKIKTKRDKKFVILYVGRLSIVKGLDYLLKAFSKLDKKNAQLVLVGGGDQEEHLKTLANKLGINNRVKFLGILDKKQLVKIYNSSGVFVLPSLKEGMSNTLLEAMSCSLPAIVTNTGGASELIKGNGFVVESKDSQELFESMKKLYSNKVLRDKMGKKSRVIAENMDWGNVGDKYLRLYHELA